MRRISGIAIPSKRDCYPSLEFEKILWKDGFKYVAGVDEAGRGALAGPVAAAAVVFPPDPSLLQTLDGVRDSKLMTPQERETWAPRIQATAVAWGIGFASAEEIDALGIVPATKLAATRALSVILATPTHSHPDYLITDYLVFPEIENPQTALIKGDQISLSVSAASVLAKTSRDAYMREIDSRYPGYFFSQHKGYGTRLHLQSLEMLGMCAIHRKTFSIPISGLATG